MRMDQRGAAAFAAILHSFFADGIALDRIGAVALRYMQSRKTAHEFGDAAAGRLNFHRHGVGIAVVFHKIQLQEFPAVRAVQRLPQLAFADRSVYYPTTDSLLT